MPQPKYMVTWKNNESLLVAEDAGLSALIKRLENDGQTADSPIHVTAQINHPKEITAESLDCFKALALAGAVIAAHVPIRKGINDDSFVLAQLLNQLSLAGAVKVSFFIYRPEADAREKLCDWSMPLKRAYEAVEGAKALAASIGNRVKLLMCHASGKIEIMSIDNGKAYLKYHQSNVGRSGHFMMLDCPEEAIWFDDLPGSEFYGKSGNNASLM
ncbi:hypothetical protein [Paenibacillus sp. NEAU-GSW1]|uniref:hypothetical protein n=1 Tax=Paenibacillus sp. NEAU-GSW1 TaxID=2682486 RepID=UPI0012E2D16A|nr:hypothetical protein [Paenibacillus sp. NEAU-GSW1]MUT66075.1 hypothetical protein [Paenibacillus sp. NEAU-GSW1]